MATLADALLTAIDTNWSVVTGGVEPSYKNDEDIRNEYPPNIDLVLARNWSHETRIVKINDAFEDRHHTITLTVSTADATNKEERLDQLVNEVVRVLSLDSVVTGVDEVKLKHKSKRATNKKFAVWRQDLIYECTEYMASGSTAIGTAAVSSLTVDTLVVNTSITGGPTAALGATTTAAITASGDITCGDTKIYASSGAGNADIDFLTNDVYIGHSTASDQIIYFFHPTNTEKTTCWFYAIHFPSTVAGSTNITCAQPINLKPSGDNDDYIEVSTTGGTPDIKAVGACSLNVKTEAGGTIRMMPSGDVDDYWAFFTNGDVASIIPVEDNVHKVGSTALRAAEVCTVALNDGTDSPTIAQLADAMMLGSANSAWIPCMYIGDDTAGYKYDVNSSTAAVANLDATNANLRYDLPIPTNRGGLKLYVKGTRVVIQDADAQAFVNQINVYGYTHTGAVSLDADGTNKDSQGTHDDAFTAVDCSSYSGVFAYVNCDVDVAAELDIQGVLIDCYYAA